MRLFNKDKRNYIQKNDKQIDNFFEVVSINKSITKQNFILKKLLFLFLLYL